MKETIDVHTQTCREGDKALYSIQAAAIITGRTPAQLRALIRRGKLRTTRDGDSDMLDEEALASLMNGGKA
ncbi:MAG: hypothetical protein KDH93_13385 [Rhodoferax sp.]|nr:hypothetical protein [Anaerolineae bacterium]MCB2006005.1 hypothetical protein [Rhodoferax sp.]